MRTSVDLPAALHGRVKHYAEMRGESLSSVLANLIRRGAESIPEVADGYVISPITGLMVFDGPIMSAGEVARLIDEDS